MGYGVQDTGVGILDVGWISFRAFVENKISLESFSPVTRKLIPPLDRSQ